MPQVMPTDGQCCAIWGHRGSGKTVELLHHVSQRSFDVMPWVLIDLKGGDHLAETPVNDLAALSAPPPIDPGLYYCRATLEDVAPDGPLDRFMLACLEQGNIGLALDEGQQLEYPPVRRGLRMLLTQGRSKRVPLVFAAQRPRSVDTFLLAECDYHQIFLLPHPDDQTRIKEHIPRDRIDFESLRGYGEYYSFWYDVKQDKVTVLEPAPPPPIITKRILTRLPRYHEPPPAPFPRRIRV